MTRNPLIRFLFGTKRARTITGLVVGVGLVGAVGYNLLFGAPAYFPDQSLVRIKKGSTLEEAASLLKEKHLIQSAILLQVFAKMYRSDGTIVAGEYAFTEPQNILTVASRLTQGDFQLTPVRVRIEEGMSVEQITAVLKKQVPDFDALQFYSLAIGKEGRLYPDTYFVLPGEEPSLVVESMEKNFESRIREVTLATAIAKFGKPLNEVLTMASLLEKEASLMQDRRIIAGILWHRMDIGMKLQVDAVFPYINGKNTFTLTRKDLLVDSPYNTYLYKGLPPGPIGSPSADAILAAVTPVHTSYVYYLSDMDGKIHYSTTYSQHLAKKDKYIDN